MIQEFKVGKDGLAGFRKTLFIRMFALFFVSAAATVTISAINDENERGLLDILFTAAILIVVIIVVVYRSVNKQVKIMEVFRLVITGSDITREQGGKLPLTFSQTEIKEIIKTARGSFIIKSTISNETLVIPYFIENYTEAEKLLLQFGNITTEPQKIIVQKLTALLPLVAIALLVAVYTCDNKWVVGITGTSLLAFMAWSLIKVQGNKNLDRKVRASSWGLILVAISVITVMCFKLIGFSGQAY